MKIALILLILTSIGISQSFELLVKPVVIPYHVRGIALNDPRFKKVLGQVNLLLRTEEARSLQKVRTTLHIAGEKYLGKIEGSQVECIIYIPPHGEGIHADQSEIQGHVIDANSVEKLGSRTMKVFRLELPSMGLDSETFIARLKEGATYQIAYDDKEVICKTCGGSGRMPIENGPRTGDGKMMCGQCMGKGKVGLPQIIEIRW